MGPKDINFKISARDEASAVFDRVGKSARDFLAKAGTDGKGGKNAGGLITGAFGLDSAAATKAFAVLGGIRAATAAVDVVTQGIKRGWDGVGDALERLPLGLGEAVRVGRELFSVLSGSAEAAERVAMLDASRLGLRGQFTQSTSGNQALSDFAARLEREAIGMTLTGRAKSEFDAQGQFVARNKQIEDALQKETAAARQARDKTLGGGTDDPRTIPNRVGELGERLNALERQREDLKLQQKFLTENPSGERGQRALMSLLREIFENEAAIDRTAEEYKKFNAILQSSQSAFRSATEGPELAAERAQKASAIIRDLELAAAKPVARLGIARFGSEQAFESRTMRGSIQAADNPATRAADKTAKNTEALKALLEHWLPTIANNGSGLSPANLTR